jgi:membrane-associated phospholipid phosphatase
VYSVLLLGGVLLNWLQILVPLFNRPTPSWLPQGRFLFPVSAPMLGLLYLGLSTWLPQRWRQWLAPLLMVVMVVMDSWILVTMVRYSYCGY